MLIVFVDHIVVIVKDNVIFGAGKVLVGSWEHARARCRRCSGIAVAVTSLPTP